MAHTCTAQSTYTVHVPVAHACTPKHTHSTCGPCMHPKAHTQYLWPMHASQSTYSTCGPCMHPKAHTQYLWPMHAPQSTCTYTVPVAHACTPKHIHSTCGPCMHPYLWQCLQHWRRVPLLSARDQGPGRGSLTACKRHKRTFNRYPWTLPIHCTIPSHSELI